MDDHGYELLDLLKKYNGDTEAALAGEDGKTAPWCLYAFSPLRENLFEWTELKKDMRILQIGSDYGSFTGLLLERAGEVTVLDELDENLEVCRLRYGENTNLRLVSGKMTRREGSFREYKPRGGAAAAAGGPMERPFDCVILAGTFERAGKKEAASLLDTAAGFLKPGGVLYAAAENEAGIRYWMGAEYRKTAFLETEFRELFEALREKNGGEFTVYYPVPDYRFPTTIYSDGYLPKPGDITNISARYESPGFMFGSEEEALAKACKNGQFPQFANSFLGVYRKG